MSNQNLDGKHDFEKYKKSIFIERENICEVLPSGYTYTLNNVYDWAKESLKKIKHELGISLIESKDDVKAYMWAYRYDNGKNKYIAFDLVNIKNNFHYCINFSIGDKHTFNINEPTVPDVVEAIHMIGLISTALGIKTEIGSYSNEVNKYCITDRDTNHKSAPLLINIEEL